MVKFLSSGRHHLPCRSCVCSYASCIIWALCCTFSCAAMSGPHTVVLYRCTRQYTSPRDGIVTRTKKKKRQHKFWRTGLVHWQGGCDTPGLFFYSALSLLACSGDSSLQLCYVYLSQTNRLRLLSLTCFTGHCQLALPPILGWSLTARFLKFN